MTLSAAVLALLLMPQSAPGVDDQKVATAIERGVAWLRKAPSPGEDNKKKAPPIRNADDLLLLTFLHAGVPQDDPRVRELLATALAAPLDRTYPVALRAMVLEELDRVRYQSHIARCAQYLLDNQLASGQWSYGEPSVTADAMSVEIASGSPEAAPAVGKDGRRTKPKVVRKLTLKQTRVSPGYGDFSNTQYAALGLRAAHDAGIVLPKEVIGRAIQAITAAQAAGPPPKGAAPNLPSGRKARGWCYDDPCKCPLHRPYGTMTAGMVSSLAIFDYILGRDSRRNTAILDGLAWLQVHYTVETVPGPIEWDLITKTTYLPYYLYGLERAGILTGNEKLGTHFWYAEGVRVLLESQKTDGSWALDDWGTPTWDTCLALLFLRRSTRPLVPSTDRVIQRDD